MITHYVDFVRQRHLAWQNRMAGLPQPWCEDSIIQRKKFTNVFRILDPGTQFVLTDLAMGGDIEDILARIFLYRHTNRVDAWRAYEDQVGRYPYVDELHQLEDFWLARKIPVFNGAYNIYPQSAEKGTNKITSVVRLTHQLFNEGDLGEQLLELQTVGGRVAALTLVPGVGDFMAMQIATDIGYVLGSDENEYILPGPGAIRGAKHTYPHKRPVDTIRDLTDFWSTVGDVFITLPNGTRRYPSLMDVQNTLCEFSKYVRHINQPPAARRFQPAHPGPQPQPVYPSHWSQQ